MTQCGPFQTDPFCDLAVKSGIKIRQTSASISSYSTECTLPPTQLQHQSWAISLLLNFLFVELAFPLGEHLSMT